MNPFAVLGLPRSADEAQIKRAYAKLLRNCRPDDDPVAFQYLYQAYVSCMDWARRRAMLGFEHEEDLIQFEHVEEESEAVATQAPDTPLTPTAADFTVNAQPVPAAATLSPQTHEPTDAREQLDTGPALEMERFLEILSQTAQSSTPEALRHWLDNHPALYSLTHQQAVGRALIAHLSYKSPLHLPQLDTLLQFFSLDTVDESGSPTLLRIEELRTLAKARGGDFREIKFAPHPAADAPGEYAFAWPTNPFFYAVAALMAVVIAVILASPE